MFNNERRYKSNTTYVQRKYTVNNNNDYIIFYNYIILYFEQTNRLFYVIAAGSDGSWIDWQAKRRIEHLEEAILQAQARETQIVEMSQWMTDVNDLLQTRLDADVLASDTPKEFEVIILFLS